MHRALGIRAGRLAAVLMAGASLTACASLTTPTYSIHQADVRTAVRPPASAGAHGTNAPYQVGGIWYVPHEQPDYDQTGIASWYGDAFNMKATADGETFDMNQFSAAHTTLPLPSMVEVTNLDNGRKLTVRVNDRGPFVGGRIIDLSRAAAQELGYDRAGTAHVRVRYVGPAPLAGPSAGVRYAKASPPPAAPTARAQRRPADEEIFDDLDAPAAAPGAAPLAAKPLVAAPEPVSVSTLAPLPAAVPPAMPTKDAPPIPPAPASRDVYGPIRPIRPVAPSQAYRIQAGAFSDEQRARRAAAQLAAAGTATVEPIERGGTTLYRVVLAGPADEAQANAFRDRVAEIGFSDARVLKP